MLTRLSPHIIEGVSFSARVKAGTTPVGNEAHPSDGALVHFFSRTFKHSMGG
jgi:hypothetical protein